MWSNNRPTVSDASLGFVQTSSKASGHKRKGFDVEIDCFRLGVLWGEGGKLRDWPDDNEAPAIW